MGSQRARRGRRCNSVSLISGLVFSLFLSAFPPVFRVEPVLLTTAESCRNCGFVAFIDWFRLGVQCTRYDGYSPRGLAAQGNRKFQWSRQCAAGSVTAE